MSQENVILLDTASQTATGQSAKRQIKTATMGVVMVDLTIASAADAIDYWLQASDDNGTTWYDVPYDQQLTLAAAAADLTANTNKRNINGTSSRTGVGKDMAVYKHLPAAHYRLAWVISGTSPDFTFKATLAVK